MKIHKCAYLNCKIITDEFREEWRSITIVFIDTYSFFSIADLENLDNKLRLLRQRDKLIWWADYSICRRFLPAASNQWKANIFRLSSFMA